MLLFRKTIVTEPEAEPISLAEARDWLKMGSSTANDAIITGLVTAARQHIEIVFGAALVTQTWDYLADAFPTADDWSEFRFAINPISSITHVKYYDDAGTLQTWSSANYILDAGGQIPRLGLAYNATFPASQIRLNSIQIRVVAGYGAAASVPEDVKTALKLLLSMWHENREDMPLSNPYGRAAYSILRNRFAWMI